MIVVADTSPLNYLILLGRPDVLRDIYGRVLVPSAVLIEMQNPEAPAEVRIWASAPPTWIEEAHVRQIDGSLDTNLGAGEREAISLALEISADVLLIDERVGRREAGTLAVLLQASLRGYFDFPKSLKELRRYGFRVSPAVEAIMLAKYESAGRDKP